MVTVYILGEAIVMGGLKPRRLGRVGRGAAARKRLVSVHNH